MTIPILSLFCGAGGLDYGFREQGFDTILALDVDPVAVSTFNLNHGDGIAQVCDLATSTGEEIIKLLRSKAPAGTLRGVIGGPPCQSFSVGNAYFKSDDVRHTLPRAYARILKALNDEYTLDFFLFENVRGLLNQPHQQEFREFKELFKGAGFALFQGELDAVQFGVPQRRPRLFIVGFNVRKYEDRAFKFPTANGIPQRTVADALRGLPDPVFFQHGLNPENFPHHSNHWAMKPKSEKFYNGFFNNNVKKGKSFRLLNWDKPSYTVAYGHNEVHVHPSGTRRLSVYEAMLLQGFPKEYKLLGTLSDQIRQVSNAVPPPLAAALAEAIRLFLQGDESTFTLEPVQLPLP